MKVETEDLITPVHAAEQRGVSRQAMNNLIRRGKFQTVWIDGVPFLRKEDVEAYEPEPAGRPPKAEKTKAAPAHKRKSKKRSV